MWFGMFWLLALGALPALLVFSIGIELLKSRYRERKARQDLKQKYQGGYHQPRVTFLDHAGHRILLLDLTYCTPEEVTRSLQEFKEILSNQPSGSILTTLATIDLTDGRFSPECIEEMKLLIMENRRFFARLAFVGHSTLDRKDERAILQFFARYYPFFHHRDDALDFVEHDDQYPIPFSLPPTEGTKVFHYDEIVLAELFSRLLRYPDDEYRVTTERCLTYFDGAKTRKRRLINDFYNEVRGLSTKQLQALFTDTFERDPACSLDMSCQLGNSPKDKQSLIDWMERRFLDRGIVLPEPLLPTDHISTGLFLESRLGTTSAYGEDLGYALWLAIENLARVLNGRNNPYGKLLTVIVLALDSGESRYIVRRN